jgi:hypothetical protein
MLKIGGKSGEFFDAASGDEVVFFDAKACAQGFVIKAGFDGEDVTLFEGIVPGGIEVGSFVGVESDTVAEVVEKAAGEVGVEQSFAMGKDIPTANARTNEARNFVEDMGDDSMGGELVVGGEMIDGEGAAIVGEVAAIGGAEIEDEEFTRLGWAIARWTTGGGALVVVAGSGGGLTEGVNGSGLQFVIDGEFGDAGRDDVAGASIHGFGGGDGVADEGEFVWVFAAAEIVEFGFKIH